MAEMGKHNEELMRAGVLLALDGLYPSSNAGGGIRPRNKRIKLTATRCTLRRAT
jgi:hypothetical protein